MTDNLSIIIHTVEQAKEKGKVLWVSMSDNTLCNMISSPSLDEALDQKGWKQTKPNVVDQSVIEFLIGAKIMIVDIEGIRVKTEKEVEVKFHN